MFPDIQICSGYIISIVGEELTYNVEERFLRCVRKKNLLA